MRKNLVIVRAGDRSLHPAWQDNSERNWDLLISYYGIRTNPFAGPFEYFDSVKGGKWDGLFATITKNIEIIKSYERIWLPDDDLLTSTKTINKFFEIFEKENFTLAQPALDHNSYVSHSITYRHPKTIYRLTDFVEIMAPCMTSDFLQSVLNEFKSNPSGWGFEWYWSNIIKNNNQRMGIIDSTSIIHTRPVGSAGHGVSISPTKAMEDFLEKFKLKATTPKNILIKNDNTKFSFIMNNYFSDVFISLYRRIMSPNI